MESTKLVERIKYVKEEKPPREDKGVWTGEPEYETRLALRLFRPPQLKGKAMDIEHTVFYAYKLCCAVLFKHLFDPIFLLQTLF